MRKLLTIFAVLTLLAVGSWMFFGDFAHAGCMSAQSGTQSASAETEEGMSMPEMCEKHMAMMEGDLPACCQEMMNMINNLRLAEGYEKCSD